MIGIETIRLSPKIVSRLRHIDQFNGLWSGLEDYTTGLQVLGDVASHGKQVQGVLKPLQSKDITTDIICALHAVQTGLKQKASYKSEDNQLTIMRDDIPVGFLDTAPHEQVAPLMNKLIEWLNGALVRDDMHPLIAVAVFCAVFLQVSPFETGNLRTARFLTLLLLMKAGYDYAPYATLDRIMNERAEEMLKALRHNQESLEQGRANWDEWLDFFFGVLHAQVETLKERLENKEKDLSTLPLLSARVMRLFEEHKRLQMNDIVRMTNGRRSTLKLRLGELVEQGYLRRHGQARSTWYSQI